MITKQVVLNDITFTVEIREIDVNSFMSQQIAVAKSYAKEMGLCKQKMIEIMAWNQRGDHMDIMNRMVGRAFY